jgi:hypothetical protein
VIERFSSGLAAMMADPDDYTCMTVIIPGDIDPFERLYRFSIHIDAELRLIGLGCSVGGGTLFFDDEDESGKPEIAYCILDIDAVDVPKVRDLLRDHLPELGIPAGSLIQWNNREDRFDGQHWQLDQPQSLDEFDP